MTNEQLFELVKMRMQLDHEYRMAQLNDVEVTPSELSELPTVEEPTVTPDTPTETDTVELVDMFKEAAQEYSEQKAKKLASYPEVQEMGSRMHYYDDKIKHEYYYNAKGDSVLLEGLVANDIKIYKGQKILSAIAVNKLSRWLNENKYFPQGSAQLRIIVADAERKAAEAVIAAKAIDDTPEVEEAPVEAPIVPVEDTRTRKQKVLDEWEPIKHIAEEDISDGKVTVALLCYAQKASQAESLMRLKLEHPGNTDKWYSDHLFDGETWDEGDARIALRMEALRNQVKRLQPLAAFPDPYTPEWFTACYALAEEWFEEDAAKEFEERGPLYFDPHYDPKHIDYDALKEQYEKSIAEVVVVPQDTSEEAVVAFVEATQDTPELDEETKAMHEAFDEFYEAKPKNEFGLDARDPEEVQRTALRALKFGEGEITKAELTAAYLEDAAKYRAEAEATVEPVVEEVALPEADDETTVFEKARKHILDRGAKFDAPNFVKELVAMGIACTRIDVLTHGTDMGLRESDLGINYMLHYKRTK